MKLPQERQRPLRNHLLRSKLRMHSKPLIHSRLLVQRKQPTLRRLRVRHNPQTPHKLQLRLKLQMHSNPLIHSNLRARRKRMKHRS